MANLNDYQLDEMENAAVNKSKNLKRGLVAGAAVVGVGGTAAFGAERIANANSEDESNELSSDDILAGANAGVEEQSETVNEESTVKEVHVKHHIVEDPVRNINYIEPEPEVNVEETAVLLDEDGEIISTYDAGTINGKDFLVIDSDLNGKGDILAYDENGNGIYEDNEISQIDNQTYEMGKGEHFNVYAKTEEGEWVKIQESVNPNQQSYAEDIDDIHNDFEDEKTGEVYRGDLADRNPDYRNDEARQYSAGMNEESHNEAYAENNDEYDGMPNIDVTSDTYAYEEETSYEEPIDYGYQDPSEDIASFDGGTDNVDDASFYDA